MCNHRNLTRSVASYQRSDLLVRVLFVRMGNVYMYAQARVCGTRVCVALALLAPARACVQDMARAHEKMKCQGENAT